MKFDKKKSFLTSSVNETLALLIVDIFILYIFTFWLISNIFEAKFVAKSFVLFVFNIQNLAFLFGIVLFVNFVISIAWHLVKK